MGASRWGFGAATELYVRFPKISSELGDETLFSKNEGWVGILKTSWRSNSLVDLKAGYGPAPDRRKKVEGRGRKFGGWKIRHDGGYVSLIPGSTHMPS